MINYSELLDIAIQAALAAGDKTLLYYRSDLEVLIKEDDSPLTLADLESNRVINDLLKETQIPILSEENKTVAFKIRKTWKRFWLIDPLDGTKEFINKRDEYTVNIALIENGYPTLGVVYAPAVGALYFGSEKQGSYKIIVTPGLYLKEIKSNASKISVGQRAGNLRIVASRSHMSDETKMFIQFIEQHESVGEMKSMGSSLKLCLVAEGSADIYPRMGPTMEWDTAASHAVVIHAGGYVKEWETMQSLSYNKMDLHNPYFVVYNPVLDQLIRNAVSTN